MVKVRDKCLTDADEIIEWPAYWGLLQGQKASALGS